MCMSNTKAAITFVTDDDTDSGDEAERGPHKCMLIFDDASDHCSRLSQIRRCVDY